MIAVLLGLLVSLVLTGCAGSNSTSTPAVDGEYTFWPPPPNEPRIQFVRSFSLSSDVEREQSTLDRLVFGSEARVLPIAKPYGVEMWNGRMYVCDISNPAVVILDLVERQTRLMVTRGVEQMTQPTDIAIADDGVKYVTDRRLGKIFVFDAEDRFVRTFGEEGFAPAGVAVFGDALYVPDLTTRSVIVLDRFDGTKRSAITGSGDETEFVCPLGVDVNASGELYVTDAIRGLLHRFRADGEPSALPIGGIGDGPGQFVRPKHVAVDSEGIVYIVDAAFQNVQMFNAEGELLMFFGGVGDFPGAMSLPAGIAVSESDLERFEHLIHPAFVAERLVLVTNQFGGEKISVYALGKLRPGRTVDDIAPNRIVPELRRTPEAEGLGPITTMPTTESEINPTSPPSTERPNLR